MEVEEKEERVENRNTMEQWVRILERVKRDKRSEEEMKSVIHYDLQVRCEFSFADVKKWIASPVSHLLVFIQFGVFESR